MKDWAVAILAAVTILGTILWCVSIFIWYWS
jgi:hypothetical protein